MPGYSRTTPSLPAICTVTARISAQPNDTPILASNFCAPQSQAISTICPSCIRLSMRADPDIVTTDIWIERRQERRQNVVTVVLTQLVHQRPLFGRGNLAELMDIGKRAVPLEHLPTRL